MGRLVVVITYRFPGITETAGTHASIAVREFDRSELQTAIDDWDDRTPDEKLQAIVRPDAPLPIAEHISSNTVCTGLHQLLTDSLDANTPDTPPIEELALGRGTGTAESDTTLNDEIGRVDVTAYANEGDQIRSTVFVPPAFGIGETITEAGLYGGGYLLNHADLTTSVEKTALKEVVIDAVIGFTAV